MFSLNFSTILRRTISVVVAACVTTTLWGGTVPAHAVTDGLSFFLSAPGVQGSFVSGVTVETFNTRTIGALGVSTTLDVGTISAGTVSVIAADVPGASSTNSTAVPYGTFGYTNFARVLAGNSMTITLGTSLNYLGFWWAAGDPNSTIEMYNGSSLVADFSTSDITTLIPKGSGKTVTAIGGSVYTNNEYYGPRGSATPDYNTAYLEPYAFVHAVAPSGTTFDTIKFIQGPSGGFEFDNLTVGTYSGTFNTGGLVGFGLANDKAVNDSYTVTAGSSLSESLAANDVILGTSAYSKDTSPSLGTATVASSGGLTFVAGDTAGTTTFDYKVCRPAPSTTCVKATVTITITAGPTTTTTASSTTTTLAPSTTTTVASPTTTNPDDGAAGQSTGSAPEELASSGFGADDLFLAGLAFVLAGLMVSTARRRLGAL